MHHRFLALLAGLLTTGLAWAEPHLHLVPDRLLIGQAAQATLQVAPDWNTPQPKIRRAVLVVHGRLRNAVTYFRSGEKAIAAAGAQGDTLLIAPQFLAQQDATPLGVANEVLRWQGDAWMGGEPAVAPVPLSSFQVLDAILARLADRRTLPNLREVVIAGHSGGGQVVQRYAVLGQGERLLAPAGIALRFVVANPSSYAYFDAQRPDAQGRPAAFDAIRCPDFDTWKYGMQQLPPYAANAVPAALERHYVTQRITYLLGERDTDPNHPALDKSCAAEAQGPYRLLRGRNYFAYLQGRHPQGLNQTLVTVPGVGHDGDAMFTSPQGVAAVFGTP